MHLVKYLENMNINIFLSYVIAEKEERKSRPAEDEDDDDYVPEVDSTEHGSLRTRKRQRSVGADGHSNSEGMYSIFKF
jgi:hypothetical protein